MTPTDIALALALIDGLNALLPRIRAMQIKGEVSAAEQQAVLDRIDALKASMDSAFDGPEWEVRP